MGRKPQLLLAVHDMELAEGPAPLPTEQLFVADLRATGALRPDLSDSDAADLIAVRAAT